MIDVQLIPKPMKLEWRDIVRTETHDEWTCWDLTDNWFFTINHEGSRWEWDAAYAPGDGVHIINQEGSATDKADAEARAKAWAQHHALNPVLISEQLFKPLDTPLSKYDATDPCFCLRLPSLAYLEITVEDGQICVGCQNEEYPTYKINVELGDDQLAHLERLVRRARGVDDPPELRAREVVIDEVDGNLRIAVAMLATELEKQFGDPSAREVLERPVVADSVRRARAYLQDVIGTRSGSAAGETE